MAKTDNSYSKMQKKSVQDEITTKIYETKTRLEKEKSEVVMEVSVAESEDEANLSFLFLENELERKGLTDLSQLPLEGVEKIVDFVNNLPPTPKLFEVLQKMQFTEQLKFPISETAAEKIKLAVFQPKLYCPYLTGTGYFCPADQLTHRVAALDLGYERFPTSIGFALPERLISYRLGQVVNICKIFRSTDEYRKIRHEELKLTQGIIGGTSSTSTGNSNNTIKVQCEPKPGYNISHKKQYADIAFTFVREYRQFSLNLQNSSSIVVEEMSLELMKPHLSLEFINRVKEVCTYQMEDYFGEKQWQHFFTHYGTHIITSSCFGGQLVLTISETQLKHYFKTNNLFTKQKDIEQLFSNYLDSESNEHEFSNETTKNAGTNEEKNPFETLCINSIKLSGGDSMYNGMDLIKSTKNRNEMMKVLQFWMKSLQYNPVMLESTIVLESIPDLLDRYGLIIESHIIDNAAKQLFGKSIRSGISKMKPKVENDFEERRRSSTLVLPSYIFP